MFGVVHVLALLACNPPIDTNFPPAIKFVEPADKNGDEIADAVINETGEEGILIRIRLIDRDGDTPMTLTVESDKDGELGSREAIEDGEIVEFEVPTLSAGQHAIVATATDRRGGKRTSSLIVEVNGAPEPPVVVIDPTDPVSGENITGLIDTPPVDSVTQNFVLLATWTEVNGAIAPIEQDEQPYLLQGSLTEKGQQWSFCVSATESDDGENPNRNAITVDGCVDFEIANQAPGAPADAEITPANPSPAEDLFCNASGGFDPDGDALDYQYQWSKFDAGSFSDIKGATEQRLDASNTSTGDEIRCTAFSDDGTDVSAAGTESDSVFVGSRDADDSDFEAIIAGDAPNLNVGPSAVGLDLDDFQGGDIALGVPASSKFTANGGFIGNFEGVALLSDGDLGDRQGAFTAVAEGRLGTVLAVVPDTGQGTSKPDLAVTMAGDDGLTVDPEVVLIPGRSLAKGATELVTDAGIRIFNGDTASGFGEAITGGDADGNNLAELFITQHLSASPRTVWMIRSAQLAGGSDIDVDIDGIPIVSGVLGDQFGAAISASGDTDGDGTADLLIGDPARVGGTGCDTVGAFCTAAWLFRGSDIPAAGTNQFGATIGIDAQVPDVGGPVATEAGYQVEILSDINADGLDDLLVSAPAGVAGGSAVGMVAIFHGDDSTNFGSNLVYDDDADVKIFGPTEDGARFGDRVVVAGDRGVDGMSELWISAPMEDATAGADVGKVYLYQSGDIASSSTLQGTDASFVVTGSDVGGMITAAGPAGDLDLDGVPDLMVAAPNWSVTDPDEGALLIWLSQ